MEEKSDKQLGIGNLIHQDEVGFPFWNGGIRLAAQTSLKRFWPENQKSYSVMSISGTKLFGFPVVERRYSPPSTMQLKRFWR